MNFESQWLGQVSYSEGLKAQQRCWENAVNGGPGTILGCEHFSVITLGKRAQEVLDVTLPREALEKAQFELITVDRGGQATLHSPGQLVIYPVISLRSHGLTVKAYIERILLTTQCVLNDLGISARIGEDSGLHTVKGKIAFVGVRVERGCTRHGVSLNVNNDLNLFKLIRPCGVSQAKLDSLKDFDLRTEDLFRSWLTHWSRLSCSFDREAKLKANQVQPGS